MNVLLESYLDNARTNLSHLPDWKRDLELMELRSHLEADVAARIELGKSEESATQETLTQFGDVRQVCGGLRQADRREKLRQLDTPERATALGTTCFVIASTISYIVGTTWIILALKGQIVGEFIQTEAFAVGAMLTTCFGIAMRIAAAWQVGKLAPRNGVFGASLGYLLSWALMSGICPLLNHLAMPQVKVYEGPILSTALYMIVNGLCFVGTAWLAGRRERMRMLGKAH